MRNAKSQREVISIHVGGAGCNLGEALWELFCVEHGIDPEGKQAVVNHYGQKQDVLQKNFFSNDKASGRMVPRSIFLDLEPRAHLDPNRLQVSHRSAIDKIRTGRFKKLFEPEQLLSYKSEALTFGEGYYSEFIEESLDGIRTISERCDSMQGFMIFNAISGGTGSGFASVLLERLADEYDRKAKLAYSIYPTEYEHPLSKSIIEPYNAVLHLSKLIHHVDISFTLDNSAIYKLCQERMRIERPTYGNLNRVIAQVISSLTISLRRQSDFNIDINEYQTNLVPFQKRHFMLASFSPIKSVEEAPEAYSVEQMTADAFERDMLLADCEDKAGDKYMACCLIYRGDVSTIDANRAVDLV